MLNPHRVFHYIYHTRLLSLVLHLFPGSCVLSGEKWQLNDVYKSYQILLDVSKRGAAKLGFYMTTCRLLIVI